MELNERAAKAMGWSASKNGLAYLDNHNRASGYNPTAYVTYTGNKTYPPWNPEHDYNHAHMLYEEAKLKRPQATRDAISTAVYELSKTTGDVPCAIDLTPAQLTKACCEVLEQKGGE